MSDSNYMHTLPGGHCFFCHRDYDDEHDFDKCKKLNADKYHYPCTAACKYSKYYPKKKVDTTKLQEMLDDYLIYVKSDDYHEDNDWAHYIYEEAVNTFLGTAVGDALKEKQ